MMEIDRHDIPNRGTVGAALGTGIAGLSLGVLNSLGNGNGLLGGLVGGCNTGCNTGCSDNMLVNRYEMAQQQKISELQSQIALRDANTYNDQKVLELYKYVDGKIACVERELADQRVFNATQIGTISCIQGQVAQLFSLTKLTIGNGSVCPGWGSVEITPAATTTA